MDIFLKTIGSINDETRVKILKFIYKNGEVCVCDIESSFNMVQSRVSRHLKILKEAGFLKVNRVGRWAYYSVRSPLDSFRQSILQEIDTLPIDIPTLSKSCESDKKVLVMCTGNSCRSIIAEALINANLPDIIAYSCGTKPAGKVNENAKKVLLKHGVWNEKYHSKNISEVIDIEFDLVVTVCDSAKEECPIFPKPVKKIHLSFEDPDGKGVEEFEKTYNEIKNKLLPMVEDEI